MGGFTSFVSSSLNFYQNLGITAAIRDVKLPDSFRDVFGIFNSAYFYIFIWTPSIPVLDIRSKLVFMIFLIPLVLDLTLSWFLMGVVQLAIHLADLIATTLLFFVVVRGAVGQDLDVAFYAIIFVVIGWCAARGAWELRKRHLAKKGPQPRLYDLGRDICNYFLSGIHIPGFERTIEQWELNRKITRFSSVIRVDHTPSPWWSVVLQIVGSLVFLFAALISNGVISIGAEIPGLVQVFVPLLSFPIVVAIVVSILLDLCECGRNFKLRLGQFITHWGLRLLLLVLDALYIPICDLLLCHLVPEKTTVCPIGEFPIYTDNVMSELKIFAARESNCTPCNVTIGAVIPGCSLLCIGNPKWLLQDDHHLRYVHDVLTVNGGAMLFSLSFVLLGIPALWYWTISQFQVRSDP
jgi:hypothetical protein